MRQTRRIMSLLLAGVLLFTSLPLSALAEEGSGAEGLCPHHRRHTEDCGYKNLGVGCAHRHTEDCYPERSTESIATSSRAETGAVTCTHVHDETCGYTAEGSPCAYVCEICGTVLTGFDGLAEEIREQRVAEGTALSELTLPETLSATGYAETYETATDSDASEAPEERQLLLRDVQWEVDPLQAENQESGITEYDGELLGLYVFTPVLPERYSLAEGVSLPEIMVMVGGVNLLAETAVDVPYLDEDGNLQTAASATVVDAGEAVWDGSSTNGWYVVKEDVSISDRIRVNGNVHLILADGAKLTASSGIEVGYGNSLTIYGQSEAADRMGALEATGGSDNAGISGDRANITIIGGSISARGGSNAAGIGSNNNNSSNFGTINIKGGVTEATGGSSGAGIGGSRNYFSGGTINISGGTIRATGGSNGAGIGTGNCSKKSNSLINVNINGGTVTATGTSYGAGIGNALNGGYCDIKINGGTVTATGGTASAGIGNAYSEDLSLTMQRCTIEISGGTVTAKGGSGAEDIGSGRGKIKSSFSTGTKGNAFIIAAGGKINNDNESSWQGIIFKGKEGKVYGTQELSEEAEVPAGSTLTVPDGSTLTVLQGATLMNRGTIEIEAGGQIVNHGTIYNLGTISPSEDEITGDGELVSASDISIQFSNSNGIISQDNPAAYGDTITITAKVQKKPALRTARVADAVQEDTVRFFIGTDSEKTELGEGAVEVDTEGIASISVELDARAIVEKKGFLIGENTITAEYSGGELGGDSLYQSSATAVLTLTKKKITAEVDTNQVIEKEYDGSTEITVPVKVAETELLESDRQDHPNGLSGIVAGNFSSADVGEGKAISITKAASDIQWSSEAAVTLAGWYEISVPTSAEGSITKTGSGIEAVWLDENDTVKTEASYVYGEQLNLKVSLSREVLAGQSTGRGILSRILSGVQGIADGSAADSSVEADKVALFYEDVKLAETTAPDPLSQDNSVTLQYDTTEKQLPIGEKLKLTVKYGGNGNYGTSEQEVKVTLIKKAVEAEVDTSQTIEKEYDGNTEITVPLKVAETALVGSDQQLAGDAQNAQQSGLNGTVAGNFDTADVGEGKVISITKAASDIQWSSEAVAALAGWYEISVPATATGKITQTGSGISTTWLDESGAEKTETSYVYGEQLNLKVSLSRQILPEQNAGRGILSRILSGVQGIVDGSAADSSVAADKVALFYGNVKLAETDAPDPLSQDNSVTLQYDTTEKKLPIGENLSLTVKYGGNGNYGTSKKEVGVTLTRKPVTAEVDTSQTIEKEYDGSTEIAVPLKVAETALAGSDRQPAGDAQNAQQSGLNGTVAGNFDTADVGESKVISITKAASDIQWSSEAAAALAGWYEISVPKSAEGNITQTGSGISTTWLDGSGAEKTETSYVYGEQLNLKVSLSRQILPEQSAGQGILSRILSGVQGIADGSAADSSVAADKVALFYGNVKLAETDAPDPLSQDNSVTLQYDTTAKQLPIGEKLQLTVRYGGNGNYGTSEKGVEVTLTRKPVTAEVDTSQTIEKEYDGNTKITVPLRVSENALAGSDRQPAGDAQNAQQSGLNGTVAGNFDTADVGEKKTIFITKAASNIQWSSETAAALAGWYEISVPTSAEGSITQTGSGIEAVWLDENDTVKKDASYVYGEALRLKVSLSREVLAGQSAGRGILSRILSGVQGIADGSAADSAVAADQVALFYGNEKLAEADAPDPLSQDNSVTLQYDTVAKQLPIGEKLKLTVRYGGNGNYGMSEQEVKVTLTRKPVKAEVDTSQTIEKEYDGSTEITVPLRVAETGLAGSDRQPAGDAQNAQQSGLNGTVVGNFDTADVGESKAISITKAASDIQWSSETAAALAGWYEISVPKSAEGNITQTGSGIEAVLLDENGAEKTEASYVYGEQMNLKVSLSRKILPERSLAGRGILSRILSGVQGIADGSAAESSVEADKVALFYGNVKLAEADAPDPLSQDNSVTLQYDTAKKQLPIGEKLKLTVKYGGNGNYGTSKQEVEVTLTRKPVKAEVDTSQTIEKEYDGNTEITVPLRVSEDALVGSDQQLAGDAQNAQQSGLNGTVAGNFDTADVGVSKAISITKAASDIQWSSKTAAALVGWYEISVPKSAEGSITQTGSGISTTWLDENDEVKTVASYVYGEQMNLKVSLSRKILPERSLAGRGILSRILSGVQGIADGSAAESSVAADKVALFYGDVKLAEADAPDPLSQDNSVTLQYNTTAKRLPIGEQLKLTVKYGGNGNYGMSEQEVEVTLIKKAVEAEVDTSQTIEKEYDGNTEITVPLRVSEDALEGSDRQPADDAQQSGQSDTVQSGTVLKGTVAGEFESAAAGENKAITIAQDTTIQWNEAAVDVAAELSKWYTFFAPVTAEGAIKPAQLGGTLRLTGKALVGETLTAVYTPAQDEMVSVSYHWERDNVSIDGAEGEAYLLSEADFGKKISVTVRAADANYAGELHMESAVVERAEEVNPNPNPGGDTGDSQSHGIITGGGRSIGAQANRLSGVLPEKNWEQDESGWKIRTADGTWARDGWYRCIWNNRISWYHFGSDGYVDADWFTDKDGQRYFLHNVHDGSFGYMYIGWKKIGEKWYYFTPNTSNIAGKWMSEGALLTNAMTPDGYKVGADGAWEE